MTISLSDSDITDLEISTVLNVLKSKRLALGPYLEKFQQSIKEFTKVKYALAVNSGTSALHLILKSLNFQKDQKMLVSPFSFISSANVALFEGGIPVFIDIDPQTYNISPQKLREFIDKSYQEDITTLMGVDIFGIPLPWDEIYSILPQEINIIEDSCEALGGEYKNKKLGTFGKAGAFAFYPNKQITTGEGGIIVTDNEEIFDLCKSMSNQGRGKSGEWLISERLGYNYRMDEMSAALGFAQMQRIDEISKKRKEKAQRYFELFKDDNRIVLPHVPPVVTSQSWFVFVLRLDLGWLSNFLNIANWVKNFELPTKFETQKSKEEWSKIIKQLRNTLQNLIRKLNQKGIESKNYFYPIHLQPFYMKMFGYTPGDYPVTELVSSLTFAIPFFSNITQEEQNDVYNAIDKSLKEIKNETVF